MSTVKNTRCTTFFFWKVFLEFIADDDDLDSTGLPMKLADERNGALLAHQIYKILPKERASQFKEMLMNEYDRQGLAFRDDAYIFAHYILSMTLQSVLKYCQKDICAHVSNIILNKYTEEQIRKLQLANPWVVNMEKTQGYCSKND